MAWLYIVYSRKKNYFHPEININLTQLHISQQTSNQKTHDHGLQQLFLRSYRRQHAPTVVVVTISDCRGHHDLLCCWYAPVIQACIYFAWAKMLDRCELRMHNNTDYSHILQTEFDKLLKQYNNSECVNARMIYTHLATFSTFRSLAKSVHNMYVNNYMCNTTFTFTHVHCCAILCAKLIYDTAAGHISKSLICLLASRACSQVLSGRFVFCYMYAVVVIWAGHWMFLPEHSCG